MVVLGTSPDRRRAQYAIYAALLCLGYALFYGWLIARSNGLPYVMDNNESFSSLWHATNLYRFGLEHSFGLTDEAYGFAPEAHPYVYTHQGNFPRIFALVIYAAGARSVEAQIVVTTFTVGLAALLFAFTFLSRATGSRPFAALACGLMFTDYVLVAQWQVVTYRVWHAFFVFSTFLCVDWFERKRNLRAFALLVVNGACLFYFELLFAACVTAAAGFYVLFRNWRKPGVAVLAATALGIGLAIGVATLCAQIVLYMGWDNFVKDASYTFSARNQFADAGTMERTLRSFMESNHIVFWYNLFDASRFRNPFHLVASVTYYELQVLTPLLALLLGLPAAACAVSALDQRLKPGEARSQAWHAIPIGIAFFASTAVVLVLALRSPFGMGWGPPEGLFSPAWFEWQDLAIATAGAALVYLFVLRDRAQARGRIRVIPPAAYFSQLNMATAANLMAAIAMLGIPLLFYAKYQPLWQVVSHHLLPEPLPRMLLLLAILLAHGVAQLGARRLLADPVRRVLAAAALFVAAGYAAYAIVYMLSPGYVFTGYRFRFAPLTVFFTDVMIAAGVYLVFHSAAALAEWRGWRLPQRWGVAAAGAVMLYWINVQSGYVALLPPDQFGILQKLRQPPFAGASFVSNTYAAPVAAFTGKWAYIDQELAQAIVVERGGARRLKTDDRYIWLADRDSNPEYRRPQYFICLVPQSMYSALEKVRRDAGAGPGYPGCAAMGLVRHALAGAKDVIPRAELVAMDTEGPQKYGHETWAILKLDWGP